MLKPEVLRIKRRLLNSPLTGLPILTGGEIGFNEQNEIFYYGLSTVLGMSAIPIAGSGAFVNRFFSQDVSGSKIFQNSVTFNSGITANSPSIFYDNVTAKDSVTINSTLDVLSSVGANNYTINGTEIVDFNRHAYFTDIDASGNMGIQGDLTVFGSVTSVNGVYFDIPSKNFLSGTETAGKLQPQKTILIQCSRLPIQRTTTR